MAGPGGGPPRRSHTKSRKGCSTCKRRHIRCDETFPQCKNCTKHKIRCPYRDMQAQEAIRAPTPDKPDLMWTPEIERAIDDWQRTGMFPFQDLHVFPVPQAHLYCSDELRLIYHACEIYTQLAAKDANDMTVWTRYIPSLLRVGAVHRFVMHALMAVSAMHIAHTTECSAVARLALAHRGIAYSGLQSALSMFSREISDAILAASLVLSWQAADWQSWTSLMQGTFTVIQSMAAWHPNSEFSDFIAETESVRRDSVLLGQEHQPVQLGIEGINVVQGVIDQLGILKQHLQRDTPEETQVRKLIGYLRGMPKRTMLSAARIFEVLQPLRDWLFWVPVDALRSAHQSPASLDMLAHLYSVVLELHQALPNIGTNYLGSICLAPIEEISRHIFSAGLASVGPAQAPVSNFMSFPLEAARQFRLGVGLNPAGDSPFYGQGLVNDGLGDMNLGSGLQPYGNAVFNYSSDSMPILLDPGLSPSEAHSPLFAPPPFQNQQQFLHIPSPSLRVARISDRDSIDGSIGFSDGEEGGSFNMGGFRASFSKASDGYQSSPGPCVGYIHSQEPSPLLNPTSGSVFSGPESPAFLSSPRLGQYPNAEENFHPANGLPFAPPILSSPGLLPTTNGLLSASGSPTMSSLMQSASHLQTPPLAPEAYFPSPFLQARVKLE